MAKNSYSDDAKSNQSSLSLVHHTARPVSESKEIEMNIQPSEGEPVRSNESTPNMLTRTNKFHTPENQKQNLRPQQFSSAPGFRFNKTIATNTSVNVIQPHQQQQAGQNGFITRNTSSIQAQPVNTSSLKVYRFNPVKTLQPKQSVDSSNPTTNIMCNQNLLR